MKTYESKCLALQKSSILLLRISMYPLFFRKHSAAVDASTCLAPDAIPMDTNPSYEEVHVYEHVDKKESKQ